MTIADLITIPDPIEFRSAVVKVAQTRGLTDLEMDVIVKKRSEWICEQYKLDDEVMEWHRKIYGKGNKS